MKKILQFLVFALICLPTNAINVAQVSGSFRGNLSIYGEIIENSSVYILPGIKQGTLTFVLPDFTLNNANLGNIVIIDIPLSGNGQLTLENSPLFIKTISTRAYASITTSSLTENNASLTLNINVPDLGIIPVNFQGTRVNDNYDIVNGGFEGDWVNNEVYGWHSFKTATGSFASFVASNTEQFTQSAEKRPGSTGKNSAKISSKTIFGQRANGNCTNGQINAGSMTANNYNGNYNFSDPTNASYYTPFVGKPDSIVFWAKYVPGGDINNTANRAKMSVAITTNSRYQDPEDGLDAKNTKIASAVNIYKATPSKGWQRLSTPFEYTSLDTKLTALMLITFSTNFVGGGGH